MKEKRLEIYLFFGLFAFAIYLTVAIFSPYLEALVLAMIFAVVFEPLYLKIRLLMPRFGSVASLATLLIVLIVVLVPLTFYAVSLTDEIKNIYDNAFNGFQNESLLVRVTKITNDFVVSLAPFGVNWPVFQVEDTQSYLLNFVSWLRGHVGNIFSSFAGFFVNLFLFLISFYYLLKDGEKLRKAVVAISPFDDRRDDMILNKLKTAVQSVVKGSILVAFIQGILTGIGFFIFGIPSAILWAGVATIAALIPSVGTALVTIPGVIFLLYQGMYFDAIGLFIWGVIVVGLIDNLLRPKLIEKGINIHPLLILFSALGGIVYFGPIGLIFGPIVLSFLFALLDIYKTIIVKDSPDK